MFARKKLVDCLAGRTPSRHARRLTRFESLEDRRVFNVDYFGGPVISNVQVETVFYGHDWYSNPALHQTGSELNQYFNFLTNSSYMDLLHQYSTPFQSIGHGSWVGGELVDRNASPLGSLYVDDSEIQQMLESVVYHRQVPGPNGNLVYMVYTDPNTEVTDGGSNSIKDFLGYHSAFFDPYNGREVFYAVIPSPVGNADARGLTAFQQQTEVASHELAEAVTDPEPVSGWDDRTRQDGEIGDLAVGDVCYLGGYAVQAEWSNLLGGPAMPYGATLTPPAPTLQRLIVQGGYSYQVTEGAELSNALVASFSDPNGAAALADYSADINWGDGTGDSAGQIVPKGNGQFVVTGSHVYQGAGGAYTLTVVIHRAGLQNQSVSDGVTVNDPPVEITGGYSINTPPGDYTINQPLVTFVDPGGNGPASGYQATLNWGDGQSSLGAISFDYGSGRYVVSGSHTYAVSGNYVLSVIVSHGNSPTSGAQTEVSITDPPPPPPPVNNPPVYNPPVNNPPVNNPPVTPPSGTTPDEQYVTAVYRAVLGRDPQTGELQSWAGQLDGGLSRNVFVSSLDHGSEYFATIIRPAYQEYLGRAADAAGLAYWTGQMQSRLTDQQLEADFIASDEFFRQAGGTDVGWVDSLYQHLLGRPTDAAGIAWWTAALAHGESRSQVAFGFADSVERATQRIIDDYSQYLARQPDAAEIAYWLGQFEHGATNENLITGFLAADEYFAAHS